jgi:hypothetical protein
MLIKVQGQWLKRRRSGVNVELKGYIDTSTECGSHQLYGIDTIK